MPPLTYAFAMHAGMSHAHIVPPACPNRSSQPHRLCPRHCQYLLTQHRCTPPRPPTITASCTQHCRRTVPLHSSTHMRFNQSKSKPRRPCICVRTPYPALLRFLRIVPLIRFSNGFTFYAAALPPLGSPRGHPIHEPWTTSCTFGNHSIRLAASHQPVTHVQPLAGPFCPLLASLSHQPHPHRPPPATSLPRPPTPPPPPSPLPLAPHLPRPPRVLPINPVQHIPAKCSQRRHRQKVNDQQAGANGAGHVSGPGRGRVAEGAYGAAVGGVGRLNHRLEDVVGAAHSLKHEIVDLGEGVEGGNEGMRRGRRGW